MGLMRGRENGRSFEGRGEVGKFFLEIVKVREGVALVRWSFLPVGLVYGRK